MTRQNFDDLDFLIFAKRRDQQRHENGNTFALDQRQPRSTWIIYSRCVTTLLTRRRGNYSVAKCVLFQVCSTGKIFATEICDEAMLAIYHNDVWFSRYFVWHRSNFHNSSWNEKRFEARVSRGWECRYKLRLSCHNFEIICAWIILQIFNRNILLTDMNYNIIYNKINTTRKQYVSKRYI